MSLFTTDHLYCNSSHLECWSIWILVWGANTCSKFSAPTKRSQPWLSRPRPTVASSILRKTFHWLVHLNFGLAFLILASLCSLSSLSQVNPVASYWRSSLKNNISHKPWGVLTVIWLLGSGRAHNREVVGSNPAWCWALFFSIFSVVRP